MRRRVTLVFEYRNSEGIGLLYDAARQREDGAPQACPKGSFKRVPYGRGKLQVDSSDAPTYYHYDQSGSTIALTDAGGAVTDHIEYSPYGTITHGGGQKGAEGVRRRK